MQSLTVKEQPEKNTRSLTVQMRPSKDNSFPVTNNHSPIQRLQKTGGQVLPHFSPSKQVHGPQVTPFTNPRYCSGCSSLPLGAMLLLFFLQPRLAANGLASPVGWQADLYFLMDGTQSRLSQLA